MIRCYSELKKLKTFEKRFEYLALHGKIGKETFGYERYLNQILYTSKRWRKSRNDVIIRDDGMDLGIDGYDIADSINVHHMNVVTIEDIEKDEEWLYDPEFLISCAPLTHKAIHYGSLLILPSVPIERVPGDTKLW